MASRTVTKKRRIVKHAVPCIQENNIDHLDKNIIEIKTGLHRLADIIDGNGSGVGMKTDLELVKNGSEQLCGWVKDLNVQFSSAKAVQDALEIERQVRDRVERDLEKKQKDDKEVDALKTTKKSFSWQKASIVFSITVGALTLSVLTLFSILNYKVNKDNKTSISTVTNKVEELGVPMIVVDKQGVVLLDSLGLKIYPKDFKNDSH